MKFYTYVNKSTKKIEDIIQKLPNNWRNINGLNLYSKNKLIDMSWAGYDNYAWVALDEFDLSEYTYENDWFDISKISMESILTKERNEKLLKVLTWNNCDFIADTKTKADLSFILSSNELSDFKFPFDFINNTICITKENAQEIINFTIKYIKDTYLAERFITSKIKLANTVVDLQSINTNPNWPSTIC